MQGDFLQSEPPISAMSCVARRRQTSPLPANARQSPKCVPVSYPRASEHAKAGNTTVASDDVAPRLFPGELDLVEHLGLDQCELVPTPGGAEGAAARGVAVAGETASGERFSLVDARQSSLRVGSDQDRCDGADGRRRLVGPLSR